MANAVFLELSYNTENIEAKVLYDHLAMLGFSPRSSHKISGATFWIQNRSILFVREDPTLAKGVEFTGLGLLIGEDELDLFPEAYHDDDTDFYLAHNDDRTFNLYLALNENMSSGYEISPPAKIKQRGLSSMSGIVLDTSDKSLLELLERGADKIISADPYTKYIFSNKFTIFVEDNDDVGFTKIILDTPDIFNLTSYLSLQPSIDILEFNDLVEGDFGDLTHKIVGYDCKAIGTEKSHSIENYATSNVLGLDLIVRQRKQYIKIKEETLQYYDDIRRKRIQS